VPEDAGLVLDESQVRGDVGSIVFAQRTAAMFPRDIEHSPMLDETCETPVAFLFGESVVGRVMDVETRVVGVPKHESKLDAAAPALGHGVGVKAMFEVYGALIGVVTMWEQQNAPKIQRK